MRCGAHGTDYPALGRCPECENERLLEENARAAESQHEKVMEHLERDLEIQEDIRYLEEQRLFAEQERVRAEEQRVEEERAWRKGQEARQQAERRRRELREGLPEFSEEFQQEWTVTRRSLEALQVAESQAYRALEAARREAAEARSALSVRLKALEDQIDSEPPSALRISGFDWTGPAWRDLVAAMDTFLREIRTNPFATGPVADARSVCEDPASLWLFLRRLVTGELRFTSPPSGPSGAAFGCSTFVLLMGGVAVAKAVALLAGGAAGLAILYAATAVFGVSPFVVVLYRKFALPRVERSLSKASAELEERLRGAVANLDLGDARALGLVRNGLPARQVHLDRGRDPAGLGPIFDELTQFLAVYCAGNHQAVGAQLPSKTTQLAEGTAHAAEVYGRAIKEVAALEQTSPDPEAARIRAAFSFMEGEIRRLGSEIIEGFRTRGSKIRLVRCPSCAGPLTSEARACAYCGSILTP